MSNNPVPQLILNNAEKLLKKGDTTSLSELLNYSNYLLLKPDTGFVQPVIRNNK